MHTSKELNKKYLVSDGSFCPVCGSDNISAIGPLTSNAGTVDQRVECPDCNSSWDDNYELVGIDNITFGDGVDTEVKPVNEEALDMLNALLSDRTMTDWEYNETVRILEESGRTNWREVMEDNGN
jgi:transposase-like protein